MSRRKKGGGGGEDCGSWMDTYGDMVTLLLCFFVMLYSMSNLDQQKWEVFVKSVFPNASDEQQIAINENITEGEFDVSGNLETNQDLDEMDELDKLYLSIVEYLSNSGVEGVSMSRGEGYAFIAFENQTFFNGDSSVLTDEATKTLDVFCEAIAPNAELISQIEIMGHTAQADPNRPNRPRTDRMLSSLRSAEVAAYIQEKNIIDPSKLIGISYGQFRPVDTFETAEGRAKNRRVEFLIVDKGADIKSMNDFYDEYYNSIEAGDVTITGQEHKGEMFTPVEGSAEDSASMMEQPSEVVPDGAAQPAEGAPTE